MSTESTRWEYKIIRAEGDALHANERHLNDLGADTDDATGGWKLVAVVAYTATHYLYLCRAALSAQEQDDPPLTFEEVRRRGNDRDPAQYAVQYINQMRSSRRVLDAAKKWLEDRTPQDAGEMALGAALYRAFPEMMHTKETCTCRQRRECEECQTAEQVEAMVSGWERGSVPLNCKARNLDPFNPDDCMYPDCSCLKFGAREEGK